MTIEYKTCDIEGCNRVGLFSYRGKCYCEYHTELFERGPEYAKATPIVSNFGAFPLVSRLRGALWGASQTLDPVKLEKLEKRIIELGTRMHMDPAQLCRHMVAFGNGDKEKEPGTMYHRRVSGYVVRFIVDRACEKVGLPASGKTVAVREDVACE